MPACFLLFLISLASAGCVATQYQHAAPTTPPAETLHLHGETAGPLLAEVESVIVYDGPGSWKRRAFWDEYVLTIANPGPVAVRLQALELSAGNGLPIPPGTDWEELERESSVWWQRNASPENFALGAGLTTAAAGGGVSALLLQVAVSFGSAPLLGVAVAGMAVSGGASFLLTRPSEEARLAITADFARRRLSLPQTLAPGDAVVGSAFFRVTPGPQRLVLRYEIHGRVERVVFDLAPLAGLHLKNRPGPETGPTPAVLAPLAEPRAELTTPAAGGVGGGDSALARPAIRDEISPVGRTVNP